MTHDWTFYAIAVITALVAIDTVITRAAQFFAWLAPQTTTKLDDKFAADLQAVHLKLDAILGVATKLIPATGVPTPVGVEAKTIALPVRNPQSGRSFLAAMLVILIPPALVVGFGMVTAAGLGSATGGCGGTQSSRAATIGSIDTGIGTAVAALRTYEHARADASIASATSLESGKADLTALRARTAPAWKAIDAALVALDTANTINTDTTLAGAEHALADAIAAVQALTGGPTP